jgi:hypothetical protein
MNTHARARQIALSHIGTPFGVVPDPRGWPINKISTFDCQSFVEAVLAQAFGKGPAETENIFRAFNQCTGSSDQTHNIANWTENAFQMGLLRRCRFQGRKSEWNQLPLSVLFSTSRPSGLAAAIQYGGLHVPIPVLEKLQHASLLILLTSRGEYHMGFSFIENARAEFVHADWVGGCVRSVDLLGYLVTYHRFGTLDFVWAFPLGTRPLTLNKAAPDRRSRLLGLSIRTPI